VTEPVIVGRINGLFGTHGWVKAFSFTRPPDNLLGYDSWLLRKGEVWKPYKVVATKSHRRTLIARLEGINDRAGAAEILRSEIGVQRAQLPVIGEDEFYWVDLMGLRVVNLHGEYLGRVTGLLETGANDVLEVSEQKIRLIPFVRGRYVSAVDLDKAEIRVDWDVED